MERETEAVVPLLILRCWTYLLLDAMCTKLAALEPFSSATLGAIALGDSCLSGMFFFWLGQVGQCRKLDLPS